MKSGIEAETSCTKPLEKAAKILGDFFSTRVKVESFSTALLMIVPLAELMLMLPVPLLPALRLELVMIMFPLFKGSEFPLGNDGVALIFPLFRGIAVASAELGG